ncbi:hypothetical protein Mcup_0911 [Metallosphaera cuprina Ar-4]|uniref:Uncharacterized protein n=1 Tax=Metallosphaera cuprina (strain Ar-4) TaxID=1006006 RepID=F4G2G8_METCR|nr:hypothetical protein Mcup_0911 [Metallosphaera cuprina Ar-4]
MKPTCKIFHFNYIVDLYFLCVLSYNGSRKTSLIGRGEPPLQILGGLDLS